MAHAELIDKKIVVQTTWREKDQVKQVPGARWDPDVKSWYVPLSWASCVQLRGVFGDRLTIGDILLHWATIRRSAVDRLTLLREQTNGEHVLLDVNPLLRDFQAAGVQWLVEAQHGLLGDEMGTGKTVQVLDVLQILHESLLPALVISPNSVKINWRNESTRWTTDVHPYVVTGGQAGRRRVLAAAAADPRALVIINFESLRAHSRLAGYGSNALRRCVDCGGRDVGVKDTGCEVHIRELNTIPFRTVIVDEAHRIKDPNAKQTRASWAIGQGPTVVNRYALTGTPIANDPSDLWSIMHFVSPDEYPRKTAFVDRYCLQSWGTYGGLEVKGLRPEHRDEFHRIFRPRFRRMLKREVASQLPPKVRSTRSVELSPRQAKAYAEIEEQLATRLPDGGVMVAPNQLVAQTRLLQFASGTMEQLPSGEFRMCDPSSKIDELLELLDELGDKPVCVAAEHAQLINLTALRLMKLKITYGIITGAQRDYERDAYLRDFQAGKLRVMLFTVKAGGTGLTMTAADTIIFLQRSWSMIDNMQAEDRVHRIGSEVHQNIHVIDLVARGTVEDKQVAKLYEKALRLDEITEDRARLRAAGLDTTELDDAETAIMNSYLGE